MAIYDAAMSISSGQCQFSGAHWQYRKGNDDDRIIHLNKRPISRVNLALPRGSFLAQILPESFDVLAKLWVVNQYQADEFLISADDLDNDVFFVLRGRANARSYSLTGREIAFVSLNIGDCFGEFAAIDNSERSSNVVADGSCIAARLSAERFRDLLKTHPDVSYVMIQILVGHLRVLSRRVVDFSTKTANMRLQERLLELALEHAGGSDQVLIKRPPTQYNLAIDIFSNREAVAREMGALRKVGLIERRKRSLFIPSISRLRTMIGAK